MAVIGAVSSYDMIQAHRARNRSYADLAAQRSEARQQAAQMTLAKSASTLGTLMDSAAQAGAGTSQLTSMIIRSRMAAEAKAKAEPYKWYA